VHKSEVVHDCAANRAQEENHLTDPTKPQKQKWLWVRTVVRQTPIGQFQNDHLAQYSSP